MVKTISASSYFDRIIHFGIESSCFSRFFSVLRQQFLNLTFPQHPDAPRPQ